MAVQTEAATKTTKPKLHMGAYALAKFPAQITAN
jgi:hypothetical protein